MLNTLSSVFFFFQAEDGIRDLTVTGVQTCALPILERRRTPLFDFARAAPRGTPPAVLVVLHPPRSLYAAELARVVAFVRAGGRVVAAGAGGGITHCVGWRTKNEEAFLLRDSFPVVSPVPALTLPPVADFLKPRRDDVAAESPGGCWAGRSRSINAIRCPRPRRTPCCG